MNGALRHLTCLAAFAASALPTAASAADTALTKVFDATGNYGVAMSGKGLDGLAGAVTIDTVYVGGPVAKAILYWGGKDSANYDANASVELRVDGGASATFDLPWTAVPSDAGFLHSNYFVRSADVTGHFAGILAGDYTVSVRSFSLLRGCAIQIVYSDGALPDSRVQIFGGGLDYQYSGRGNDQDGEGKTFVHDVDPAARTVDVHVFASDAHWDRVGTPRSEQLYYKQGIGSLAGAYGTGELVTNSGSDGGITADSEATLLAADALGGSDGKDWDTYHATVSLTPALSGQFSLDIQSIDESFFVPSVAFRSAVGASASEQRPAVWAMVEQADGKVVVGGEFVSSHGLPRRNIVRLSGDGTVDTSFNPGSGFDGAVRAIAVRPDGKILVGGEFSAYNGQAASRVILLNPDGSAAGALATPDQSAVWWVGVQPDGKMLYAGDFTSVAGSLRAGVARLNSDGTLDGTFLTGSGTEGGLVRSVLQDADGSLILAGDFASYDGNESNGFARLASSGVYIGLLEQIVDGVVGGVGEGGSGGVTHSVSRQADGKLLVAGEFSTWHGQPAHHVARLDVDRTVDSTLGASTLDIVSLREVVAEGGGAGAGGVGNGAGGTGGTVYSGEATVGTNSDDAEEIAGGTVLLRSADLEMAYDDGAIPQVVGVRFSVPSDVGQTISGARIIFTADASSTGSADLTIAAHASDDAPIFTEADEDLSSRSLTSARVAWSVPDWIVGESGAAQTTPDLTAIVQEIIDRPGWEAGNHVAFLIAGSGLREAKSFDADPALAPRLALEWESESAGVLREAVALYTFEHDNPSVVADVSDYGAPLDLTLENASVTAGGGQLGLSGPNRASNATDGNKLFTALKASGSMSVEAWITPASASQSGPARIVTLSTDAYNRNFTLGQDGNRYQVRIRTTKNGNNGDVKTLVSASSSASSSLTHVAFTRDAGGSASLYINGVPVDNKSISGTFENWNASYDFGLGNEFATASENTDNDWQGTYHRVAVFDRALSPGEVFTLYTGGPGDGLRDGSVPSSGTITAEFWQNIPGAAISDLLDEPRYPASPDQQGQISQFQIPGDAGDNYGVRVHGYLIPASTGTYQLYLSGDGESALYLSTDSSPGNIPATPTAALPGPTEPLEWERFPEQRSAAVSLVAGQRYYVRALMKESDGSDHLAVGWVGPGISAVTVIPGANLAPYAPY